MRALCLALLLTSALLASSSDAQTLSGHRMIFAPTAHPVPTGQWSIGARQVILPTTTVGFGRGVSLETGVLLEPKFGGVFAEPKLALVNRPRLAVSIGASGFADPFYNDGRGSTLRASIAPFAVTTFGVSDVTDVTLGAGAKINVRRIFGPWNSDGIRSDVSYDSDFYGSEVPSYVPYVVPAPVLFAGTEVRLSKAVTWVSEVGTLPDQHARYSIPSLCQGCPLPPMPLREEPVLDRGHLTREVTLGSVFRYESSRFGLDGGLIVSRSEDSNGEPEFFPIPWIAGTVALTK